MPAADNTSPYAVIVFGNTPKPAVLNTHDNLDAAERARREWLDHYAHRPDLPPVGLYQHIEPASQVHLLAALDQLAARITDQRARAHIESAIQEVTRRTTQATPPRLRVITTRAARPTQKDAKR